MKMADDQPTIPSPQSGESLEDYLKRFTDVEFKKIVANKVLLNSYSIELIKSFSSLREREDRFEKLWNIIRGLNNFHVLQDHIKQLTPVRKALVKSLDEGGKEIESIYKLCTFGRILGTTVDIAGTLGGLLLRKKESSYVNMAFGAATSFGLLSLVSSNYEMNASKNIFGELMNQIKIDQQLVEPIKRWYQQSYELEEAMRAVFPFNGFEKKIHNLFKSGETEFTQPKLLSTFLESAAEEDINSLRNVTLICNLISFTSDPASKDWIEWILLYRHPIMLDITRVVLQLQYRPYLHSFWQYIPALPIENQNLWSIPVWGRIALNAGTMYVAIKSLSSSRLTSVTSAITELREHLSSELSALERIVEFVETQRNRQK